MASRRSDAEIDASVSEERERLTDIITRWNEHRLDLFEISTPNEVRYCICLHLPYVLKLKNYLIYD